jgi:deazaflavin-dependent oxidoreductase (nitroreductase family)
MNEPFAARLHFIPRLLIRYPQRVLIYLLRWYFERAPGWVLLTTQGRKTGLPREVLLPCERFGDRLFVISTYGGRSDWIRNISKNPAVQITSGGRNLSGRAEVITSLEEKQSIVSEHPFFVPLPIGILNVIHRTVLRPIWVPFLRWWVTGRPVVVILLPVS